MGGARGGSRQDGVVREMLRDAPRLCAERLPIDKAEGGAANVQNESWVQEGAVFDPDAAYESYARLLLSPHDDELVVVVEAPRRLAALRHRRRRSPRRRLAAHLARGAAPPLRRPLRRRRAGGGGGLAGTPSLDALDAWAASLNASTPNYNGTRWLAKCLRWHAYDYAGRAASRRRVPTSDSSSAPARAGTAVPATSSPASAAASPARCCRRRNCRAGGSSSSTVSPAAP